MTTIGAEVGQKMRSAIKAKLLELDCYVDDELPDYVMVMVANKRTKSQMKEDLQLFLSNKTSTFVDWLHIVLKKLKEVTVTNPDVYKKPTKRKCDELPDVKKEKKDKKPEKKIKKEAEKLSTNEESVFKSLTDDLPLNVAKLAEQRKITIMNTTQVNHDSFDIPSLSEVNLSTEEELEDIEKKIKSVKSRLGMLVQSDDEQEYIKLKPEPDELLAPEGDGNKKPEPETVQKKSGHAKITFKEQETTKRKSVLERLGKRRSHEDNATRKRSRIDFRRDRSRSGEREKRRNRRNSEKPRESVLSRLGVMSKVSVPVKPPEEPEEPVKNREVPSVVKVKPRTLPPDVTQPNKNLLLKAVAEAQRSIAQAPKSGGLKPDALYTKGYKDKLQDEKASKKLPEGEKIKTKKIIEASEKEENAEYVPEPIPSYVPSASNGEIKQKFIVTLDGIETTKFKDLVEGESPKEPIKSRLEKKKSPSPIIFDVQPVKAKIPDKLPIVHAAPTLKNKERCKYWPLCKQGDKCEFFHPSASCDKFPHCKFGDKCLFIHPVCKFGSSCTRRDCAYSHAASPKGAPATKSTLQTCKFFPNCTNPNCAFYHPKPCKFGKYCKNQAECTFSHNFVPNKSSLTWRSK